MRPMRCDKRGPLTALATALLVAFFAPHTHAAAINADLGMPGDQTHSGNDGALSNGGAVWNGVVYNVNATGLVDEMGSPTAVGVVYLPSPSPGPFLDFAALNNLQDTGMSGGGFDIRPLDSGATYTLVVYATMGSSFNLLHAGGNAGGSCSQAPPTYALPGTMGQDYCRFENLVPMEVSPGVYGIRLSGLSGAVTGFQILGSAPEPEDTLPPSCTSAWLDAEPSALEIVVSDGESGLASINVLSSENAVVDIAAFEPGTTAPVPVSFAPVDPALLARVSVGSSDMSGNEATCEFEIAAIPPPPPDGTCSTPETCCVEMVEFYQSAGRSGAMRGFGRGRAGEAHRRVMERALERACSFIHAGDTDAACNALRQALRRTDGRAIPPDFVEGDMVGELAGRIQSLRQQLGCVGGDAAAGKSLRPVSEDGFREQTTWGMLKSLYGSEE